MSRTNTGTIDQTASGRWRARYQWQGKRYTPGHSFKTKGEAQAWINEELAKRRRSLYLGAEALQTPEDRQKALEETQKAGKETFGSYALRWVNERRNSKGEPLSIRTRDEYLRMINEGRLQPFFDVELAKISTVMIRAWYAEEEEHLTAQARAYDLLKTILKTAVDDDIIPANPAKVRGGSQASTGKKRGVPSEEQIDLIMGLEDIDPRWKAVIGLGASGGFRINEILALKREDITPIYKARKKKKKKKIEGLVVEINKQIVHDKKAKKWKVVDGTKSEAGVRKIRIYGQDVKPIWEYVSTIPTGALFTGKDGGVISYYTFRSAWQKILKEAGVKGQFDFHSLRHYQGTHFAQVTGATLKEIMARLGHSTPTAALRYQHSGSRDDELARKAAR